MVVWFKSARKKSGGQQRGGLGAEDIDDSVFRRELAGIETYTESNASAQYSSGLERLRKRRNRHLDKKTYLTARGLRQ